MELRTVLMDGTRLNAVRAVHQFDRLLTCCCISLPPFNCKSAKNNSILKTLNLELCVSMYMPAHVCVKHVASCRPGEVLCANGQCKPQSSQCVSQSTCADSSEEGTCGE